MWCETGEYGFNTYSDHAVGLAACMGIPAKTISHLQQNVPWSKIIILN